MLASLVQDLVHVDRHMIEAWGQVRWEPLTAMFIVLSAWWVKAPLFVLVGSIADVRARKFPRATACAATGAGAAAFLGGLIKEAVDRLRPAFADPTFSAAVTTPETPSFPSGHATTAFAAAVAVGAFYPRLRLPLVVLAALVGLSRIYLGVHYTLDVLAGAALGIVIGLTSVWAVRRVARLA